MKLSSRVSEAGPFSLNTLFSTHILFHSHNAPTQPIQTMDSISICLKRTRRTTVCIRPSFHQDPKLKPLPSRARDANLSPSRRSSTSPHLLIHGPYSTGFISAHLTRLQLLTSPHLRVHLPQQEKNTRLPTDSSLPPQLSNSVASEDSQCCWPHSFPIQLSHLTASCLWRVATVHLDISKEQ